MDQLQWVIAGLGALILVGVSWRMQSGFGPFNLRAVGIISISTIATLLALRDAGSLTAAMGILGAVAGYLFGIKEPSRLVGIHRLFSPLWLISGFRSRVAKEVMWHESHTDHLRREADYSLSFAEWRR